ncbi:hypothetical protein [Neorhodopirellula lusitana]|uniref:hypothetical protein n=1 Tax=Neorhodopirellula lusitana TaxID=445327 RepID=UPI00384FF4DD
MTDAKSVDDSNQSSGSSGDATALPRMGWRSRCLVLLVLVHLFLVWVSLCSSVQPSQWASSVLQIGHAYLQATHFGVDGRPVYLAHGKPEEQSLRLQLDGVSLLPERLAGAGADDRQQRWLSTARLLATEEQPSLVAELILGLMRHQTSGSDDLASELMSSVDLQDGQKDGQPVVVSLLREPTILSSVLDDQQPPAYQARVVVDEGRVALVRLLPERLTATARTDGLGGGGAESRGLGADSSANSDAVQQRGESR